MKSVVMFAGVWCTAGHGAPAPKADNTTLTITEDADVSCLGAGECCKAGDIPLCAACCSGISRASPHCSASNPFLPEIEKSYECLAIGAVANIDKYPGYDGSLAVAGFVVMAPPEDGNVTFVWGLSGLEETACDTRPEGVANACGIHIHVGKTCEDAAEVGGHYYNGAMYDSDPWQASVYKHGNHNIDPWHGQHMEQMTVAMGETDIEGRVFVVHDSTGARIGCGLIGDDEVRRVMHGSVNVV